MLQANCVTSSLSMHPIDDPCWLIISKEKISNVDVEKTKKIIQIYLMNSEFYSASETVKYPEKGPLPNSSATVSPPVSLN